MKLVHSSSFLPSIATFLAVAGTQQTSESSIFQLDPFESEFDEECSGLSYYSYGANPFTAWIPPATDEVIGSEAWEHFNGLTNSVSPDLEELIKNLSKYGVIPVNDEPELSVSYKEDDAGSCLTTATDPTTTTTTTTQTVKTSTTITTTTTIIINTVFETPTTETKCGPDITSWLVSEMNKNKNHPVIKTNRDNDWAMWIPGFNIGWHYAFLKAFQNLVKAGAVWDYKATQDFTSPNCPKDCPNTVTLCGICFFYDVPGNIHYGWVGRAGRIRAWFLHNRAAAAQAGGVDDPKDTAAINIGINLWDGGGGDICAPIRAAQANLATRDCPTCSEKHPLVGKPKKKKQKKNKNKV